ncbi:ParB/RepB/Spo0J family partition protein [Novosphingobium clariflavum]|uniref:ParB/RepB/Spo0J family partition protein n=1 Tax=Novosphingobium clariflavum TaxID=2029884 RepID=A0ABV6S1E2_9SPHN|nr:ParB/RepB/Spo0J family partition protein [Novosphingobium clariflavum]
MTYATVRVSQLVVSPANVRTNQEDAESVDALKASIRTVGLMLPMVAHHMPEGSEADYGVLAGGRRLRALQGLIADGALPEDHETDIVLRDLSPAQITQMSLHENLLRRDLRPYEINAAIARAHVEGAAVETIAANIGQEAVWVARQLRLGQLEPAIFAAYADRTISSEVAEAYAATEDRDLQRAAWKHFSALRDYDRTPSRIRAYLKVGDAELERLLRFVGPQIYQGQGGRIELDLFADGPERGRVSDEGILRDLAESKLADFRESIKAMTCRPGLRFVASAPGSHGFADTALELFPAAGKSDSELELPDGDIVATVEIGNDGAAEAHYWWASRKAKRDAEQKPRQVASAAKAAASISTTVVAGAGFNASASPGYAMAARAAAKEEHGVKAEGLHVMRSIRREILRAILVDDAEEAGTIGRDYIVWAQLRIELGKTVGETHVGARGLTSTWRGSDEEEPADFVAPFVEDAEAHAIWENALDRIVAEPFMRMEQPEESLAAFHSAPEHTKRRAAAVLAGLALLRSANTPGWRVAAHDAIAELACVDDAEIRRYWSPTPRFMALFPKMRRLELAQPHVEEASFREWHKLNDQVLTGATAGALQQNPGWVHPLLSFGVATAPEDGATGQSASREVAE